MLQISKTERRHYFATMAFQSYPTNAYYLTISEAGFKDEVWQGDKSQAFVIQSESINNGAYMNVLSIHRRRTQKPNNRNTAYQKMDFTVLIACGNELQRAEFSVTTGLLSTTNKPIFDLKKAILYKSAKIDYSAALVKAYTFPYHHQKDNAHWPEFSIYMTITKNITPMSEAGQEKERVRDGLMISEYFLRNLEESLDLMKQEINVLENFTTMGMLVQNKTFKSSNILVEDTKVLYATKMKQSQKDGQQKLTEQSLQNFGNDWVLTADECAQNEPDYSIVPFYGLSNRQIVSYLSSEESSKENMFNNEIALADAIDGSFKIFNNIDNLVKDSLQQRCRGDFVCASYFSLCFRESSKIFLCDKNDEASGEIFVPQKDWLVTDFDLVGSAFKMQPREKDMCYLSTTILQRIDGTQYLYLDEENSKRIRVKDPGEAPYFTVKPKLDWYLGAGGYLEIPFSNFEDPEGSTVYFNLQMRKALKFAYFDYEQNKIIIEKRMTDFDNDAGNYTITLELSEMIDGVQVPPRRWDLTLTIGEPIPAEPLPPLKVPAPGQIPPTAQITEFSFSGRMTITISKPLNFPDDMSEQFIGVNKTDIPLYGESKDIQYIRNAMVIELIPGEMTDPTVLGFTFDITSWARTEITLKFNFENPLEISQNDPPEKINVRLTMDKFTDDDGLAIPRGKALTKFVPRQIPSEAEAEAIDDSGSSSEGFSAAAMGGNFIISLILAASLNQLWSMLNGLQLAVHLPLFFTTFPANANFFITFLIDVATFDMLPDDVIAFFFTFPEKDSYNLAFQATRYESVYAIANLGTCFMMINVYIMQLVLWVIFSCFSDTCKCANDCQNKYSKVLFWGTPIRILFEGYLELCLSIFVSLVDMKWENEGYAVIYNNVFTIIMVTLLLALPLFIAIFYTYNIENMDDEAFIESYGDIYDGLLLSKNPRKRLAAVFYPFWFVTRRLIFALVCIWAEKDFMLQIICSLIAGLVNICYLCAYQPFEERKILALEVMNETTNFILLYHVMCFTNFIPGAEDRYLLGWSFIGFLCCNMLVHLLLLVKDTVLTVRESCKKNCCRKPIILTEEQKEQLEKRKRQLSIIAEEDELQSNFSEKNSIERKECEKLSDSEWQQSKLGDSELLEGYKMGEIRWTDLGRKYIVKKGRFSMRNDFQLSTEELVENQNNMRPNYFYTSDDRLNYIGQENESGQVKIMLNRISEEDQIANQTLSRVAKIRNKRYSIDLSSFQIDETHKKFELPENKYTQRASEMLVYKNESNEINCLEETLSNATADKPAEIGFMQNADINQEGAEETNKDQDRREIETTRKLIMIDTFMSKQQSRMNKVFDGDGSPKPFEEEKERNDLDKNQHRGRYDGQEIEDF